MWAVPAQSHSVMKHSYAVSLVISGPNVSQSNPRSVNMTRYLTIQTIQHLHPLYMECEPEIKMPRFLLIWQMIKIGSILSAISLILKMKIMLIYIIKLF